MKHIDVLAFVSAHKVAQNSVQNRGTKNGLKIPSFLCHSFCRSNHLTANFKFHPLLPRSHLAPNLSTKAQKGRKVSPPKLIRPSSRRKRLTSRRFSSKQTQLTYQRLLSSAPILAAAAEPSSSARSYRGCTGQELTRLPGQRNVAAPCDGEFDRTSSE